MDDLMNGINFELNEELTLEHRKNTILQANIAAYKNREEELEKKNLELSRKLQRANKQLEILKNTTKSIHDELRERQTEDHIVLNIHINQDLPMPILQADRSVQTSLPVPVPQAGDASAIPHSLVVSALAVGKLFAKIPLTQGNVKAALTGGYVTYELVGANLLNVPIKPFYRPAAWIGKSVGKKIGTTVKPKSKVPANCRPNEDKGTHGSVIGMSPTPIVPPVPTEL